MQTLTYVFFALVAATALWGAMWPETVCDLRKRQGWSESWWSGGAFYSTPNRTRLTSIVLLLVVLVVLVLAIS
jgi:hypothetical protein